MRRSVALLALLSLAGPATLGASSGCASSGKREARALVAAVDRYRHAEGPTKPGLGQAVGGVTCTDRAVCDAKRACLLAIEPTSRAWVLKEEVRAELADVEGKRVAPTSPEAQALPGKLDEADRLLGEGRARMVECERRIADLEIAYGM